MNRRIIIRDRQGGKTTAMLKWIREAPKAEHRVIVTPTRLEAMRLLRENPDLESWQFVTIPEVQSASNAWAGVLHRHGGHIVLGIDNLDVALSQLIHWPVGALSLTDDDWKHIDMDW